MQTEDLTHVLYWNVKGRKGQRCKVIKSGRVYYTVEFADGFRHVIDKRAVRRAAMSVDLKKEQSKQDERNEPLPKETQDELDDDTEEKDEAEEKDESKD